MKAWGLETERRAAAVLVAIGLLAAWLPLPLNGQVQRSVSELEGVEVIEHLDAQLPLDAAFVDDRGKPIRLADYFQGERPAILSLNYSDCPMLCSLQLNGLVEALQQIDLRPGEDFDVLSVSVDPLESPIRARQTKQKYLRWYGQSGTGNGWHFLTGKEPEIKRVAESVGFGYRYVPERDEYAHAAVFMIVTPDGRISRYLYGVAFDPTTVRLSLVEAAEGKIGSSLDQVLLFCFQYDAAAGSYALTAINLMKLGGAVTVLLLAATLIPVWRRRDKRRAGAVRVSASTVSHVPTS